MTTFSAGLNHQLTWKIAGLLLGREACGDGCLLRTAWAAAEEIFSPTLFFGWHVRIVSCRVGIAGHALEARRINWP